MNDIYDFVVMPYILGITGFFLGGGLNLESKLNKYTNIPQGSYQ